MLQGWSPSRFGFELLKKKCQFGLGQKLSMTFVSCWVGHSNVLVIPWIFLLSPPQAGGATRRPPWKNKCGTANVEGLGFSLFFWIGFESVLGFSRLCS